MDERHILKESNMEEEGEAMRIRRERVERFMKLFSMELSCIRDGELLEDVEELVKFSSEKEWFEHFLTLGASSTGKYHPMREQGDGGLVYHSRSVFWVMYDFLRARPDVIEMSSYTWDEVLIACLFHDLLKYNSTIINEATGKPHTNNAHPMETSSWINFWREKDHPKKEDSWIRISSLILSHHGRWSYSRNRETGHMTSWEMPHDELHWLIHYADYIVSRNYIDIDIVKAYNTLFEEKIKKGNVPSGESFLESPSESSSESPLESSSERHIQKEGDRGK